MERFEKDTPEHELYKDRYMTWMEGYNRGVQDAMDTIIGNTKDKTVYGRIKILKQV